MRPPLKQLQPRQSDLEEDETTPILGLMPPSRVAAALRLGVCPPDRLFDRFLPLELQVVSRQYWTPLVVAMRVAQWLEQHDVRTVLDIGAGPGKLCVGAALAGRTHFTGLEQRERLVSAARDLARVFEVSDRVAFLHGALGETLVPETEAYYLYNPFGENLFGPEDCLDGEVELGDERYQRDIATVEELLRQTSVGTYLVTYNGFGGDVPPSYSEIRVDRRLPSVLRMWRKTRSSSSGDPQSADAL
jgi:SAM-dependent methyltransferase